jgi:hypothetical protein
MSIVFKWWVGSPIIWPRSDSRLSELQCILVESTEGCAVVHPEHFINMKNVSLIIYQDFSFSLTRYLLSFDVQVGTMDIKGKEISGQRKWEILVNYKGYILHINKVKNVSLIIYQDFSFSLTRYLLSFDVHCTYRTSFCSDSRLSELQCILVESTEGCAVGTMDIKGKEISGPYNLPRFLIFSDQISPFLWCPLYLPHILLYSPLISLDTRFWQRTPLSSAHRHFKWWVGSPIIWPRSDSR